MALTIDLYWSFRSPYSYLATGRLVELARDFDVEIQARPVLPLAIRTPDFFKRTNPLFAPYLLRDTVRVAERLGIPYRWPRPDPVVQNLETREIAAEQPYIHRLTRLGAAAAERGSGLAFFDQVSRLIWNGEVEGWDTGDHLAGAAERAGLDLAEMDTEVAAEPDRFDETIERNQADHIAAGHWGVPTMFFDGEPFYGQDRIELLIWRLEQNGLKRR